MKKFKDIKVGDRIYTATIKDSVLLQDCVGGIVVDYYVNDVEEWTGECSKHMSIKLERMRYMYNDGYVKDDRPEAHMTEMSIYPLASDTSTIKWLEDSKNDEYELLVNQMVCSTTKKGVFDALSSVLNKNSMKVDGMLSEVKKAKMKSSTMNILFSNSLKFANFEQEEEEREITEEEFASMEL